MEAPHRWTSRVTFPSAPRSNDNLEEPHRLHPSQQNRGRSEHPASPPWSLSPQATSAANLPPTSSPTQSSSELCGPSRVLEQLSALPPARQPRPQVTRRAPSPSPSVRFDESQLASFAAANCARMDAFKDELALAAGKVTPGVDDTPYIQYALEALTRDRESFNNTQAPPLPSPRSERCSSSSANAPRSSRFMVPGFAAGKSPQTAPETQRESASAVYAPPRARKSDLQPAQTTIRTRQQTPPRFKEYQRLAMTGQWIPVDKNMLQTIDPRGRTYAPLTFKPRILRPFSMLTLMSLCALMMAGLVFCNVYSQKHLGLTPYPGSIYSSQYFVFRILPQLLAGIILLYAQNIVSASLRIAPFASMAKEDPQERYLALFQNLYPKSFLLPQLMSGSWQLWVFGVSTWLMNFAIPLQSAAFTCVYTDDADRWNWAASEAVVWTLVALYATLLITTCVLMTFWFGHWTGLIWDARSLADLIPLLNRTNTLGSYRHKGPYERSRDCRAELRERWFDRLGYWQTEDMTTRGIWHTIGTSAMLPDQDAAADISFGGGHEARPERGSNELSVGSHLTGSPALLELQGARYMPWCLRDVPLVMFALVTGSLLLALLTVSFLPQTRLEAGFPPLVSAKPGDSAFSAANFLYSFLPAALGMVLFSLFQSTDTALRILQPWGELAQPDGAAASRCILADYAACLPLQATWAALRNGHWRVAVVSLMALVFIFIPILGGGLLMALTSPAQQVRMYPHMPVFGVLLALLVLYVGCLFLLLPRRRQFGLPHAVDNLASLIDFCTAEDLVEDAAFRSVLSRDDLQTRLGVGRGDGREESVWFFGISAGRDEKRLSVRRMDRYTGKMNSTRLMASMV
ncbi:uncharacterized protein UV8b_02230 [Ustilaginoidea virens]|uniref:Phosphoribosylaminoimidazole-succinocarboxamide synthase n=2 Tax=Ustilaginoidea virens TaxID=1159556 RepID=A0A8E5HM36_USTVR|nr:uncharacterized protein UV8b_02230 [Ustilaginoidea virens]QUC17989.1 hypothetical protein UV8b_02230 [Ustilaginoidea virens]